ncbi:MAG: PTS sugar transporter subunit IIA [Bacillota bacterium]|nr:PTS sugar transporter subunit IIA [Bacillota bacterium]
MISERQIQILTALYNTEGFITFHNIAEKLNVSVKTVRNDIAAIKNYLTEHETGKLITRPHSGAMLSISVSEWDKLCSEMRCDSINIKDNPNILFYTIYALLKQKSISVLTLTNKFYASRALVDKTLESAKNWFHDNHILLEKIKGKGIEISYTEYNFRIAVCNFFNQFKNYICESGMRRASKIGTIDELEYKAMSDLLNGFDIDGVMKAINNIESKYGFRYSYYSNTRALILLSLGVIRTRKQLYAQVPTPAKCKTDGTFDDLLVEDLANDLEKRYNVKFPNSERDYIKFVLAISEIQEFKDNKSKSFYQSSNIELCKFTVKFINLISEMLNVKFKEDNFLVEQAFLQLKTMIERLKYHVVFKNPLLKQIKSKYPNTMAIAWAAGNLFDNELELDINEHEVGYLALHIGGAMERRTSFLKACIVCDYGIGISQLLKEKIERTITDLEITDVLSNRDIRRIKNASCDFIISSLPLEGLRIEKDVIVVEHLLLPFDIDNIENEMKRIRKDKLRTKAKKNDIESKNQLFNKDLIFVNLDIDNKEELLKFICRQMENMGYVTKGFKKSVLERETNTSTEVGQGIALPHGRPKYVNRSIAAVATLNKPIIWFDDNEEVDMLFLLAFDLDKEKGMRNEIIKFYKSFATFLDSDEAINQIKQSKDVNVFFDYLNNW